MRKFGDKARVALLLASVAASPFALAAPAFAQDGVTEDEEIVVTARRTEESLQEVPASVSAFSEEQLQRLGATDATGLQGAVPNLNIVQGRGSSNATNIYIRGVGQPDALQTFDPAVGFYVDGVYYSRIRGTQMDLLDIERVEVLRGPQGTLYGKNTIGGAIKYVSRELTDDASGTVSITGGDYNTQEARVGLSGALVPGKLRGKVAFASLQRDGFGTNRLTGRDVSDKDTTAFRAALDWLASDAVKVQFSYDMTKDSAEPKGYQRLAANPLCPLFLGGRTCLPLNDNFDTESGLAPLNSTDAEGYSLTVGWELSSAWNLKSITAYRKSDSENNIDFDTTPARITDVIATYGDDQTSQELQLLYDDGGKFTGVFGAYYFDGKAFGLVKNIFLNRIFGTTEGETKTESFALFGEGSYTLSDRATLNLGLRATQEKKTTRALNRGFTNDTFTVANAVTADFNKSKNFDSVAPKIGIDFKLTPDVLAYLTLSRGFKSGGFNVRAQATVFPRSSEPFDDEVLTVAELGLKSVLLDRQLVFNTAVFYGKYEDIQVSTFTAFDSNGDGIQDAFFGDFLNAGNATMKGAEVEFDWNPRAVEWLRIAGNLSYLDATPDDFLDANRDGFVDTQVITNAPKSTGSLRAYLDFPVANGLFTANVGFAHRDKSVLTNEGGPFPGRPGQALNPITQGAYQSWDAGLSWLSPSAKWRFGINGKNLSDEDYITNGYNIPALGILVGSYGAPRTVSATIDFKVF